MAFALLIDNTECAKTLIDAGAEAKMDKEQKSTVYVAATLGSFECLKELLITGSDANVKTLTESLISAVRNRKAECVKQLLKSGADVNATDELGNTALMTAIQAEDKAIFLLLVDWGAEVNAENIRGETALYLAVIQSHAEYEKMQSKDQDKQKHIFNKEFQLEGASLMVYILLREGACLYKTSVLDPCIVHLTSAGFGNPNPTVLKILDAAGSKKTNKKLSSFNLLQDCVQDFIREHLKQVHPERNLYYTVPKLGLPKSLQSSLLLDAIQNFHTVPNSKGKKLLQNIKEGDTENAQQLINGGVDVNSQDETDMTPLMIAFQAGHTELVEQLIKSGADVNLQDSSGDTALIHASRYLEHRYLKKKIQECVPVLLRHHAMINIQGKDGETALMHMARIISETQHAARNMSGNRNLARALKEIHAPSEKHLLDLINSGADPNLKNDRECTALILGANILNFVKEMIKAGVDVNWKDRDGRTALAQAANLGAVDCMRTLIESGAEINSGSPPPLMSAAKKGHVDCMKLLIQEGADLDSRDKHGYTALVPAAFYGQRECVRLLIQEGADLDIQGQYGNSAVMAAAKNGHEECVKVLVAGGADLNICNEDGDTALMIAAHAGADSCFNTLLNAGVEYDPEIIGKILHGKQTKLKLNSKAAWGKYFMYIEVNLIF